MGLKLIYITRGISFIFIFYYFFSVRPGYSEEKELNEPLGISVGVDYYSDYLWRGMDFYQNDGAFLPYISYEYSFIKLYLGLEYSEDYVTGKDKMNSDRNLHTADFGADITYAINSAISISVGAWYYYFYNEPAYDFLLGTFTLSLHSIPLTPSITYEHDYYVDTGDKKDFYIKLGVEHVYKTDSTGINLGLSAGYYRSESTDKTGVSDVEATLGVHAVIDSVTFFSNFVYVHIPGNDYNIVYSNSGERIVEKYKTYTTFGVKLGI